MNPTIFDWLTKIGDPNRKPSRLAERLAQEYRAAQYRAAMAESAKKGYREEK